MMTVILFNDAFDEQQARPQGDHRALLAASRQALIAQYDGSEVKDAQH